MPSIVRGRRPVKPVSPLAQGFTGRVFGLVALARLGINFWQRDQNARRDRAPP